VTAASFERWERLREQREGGALARWLVALVAGGILAALVEWRARTSVVAASHLWLAGACAAFVVAFMRVPMQIYWRKDAAMLAQLPIEGGVLFDAAIRRCRRAAIATLVVPVLGAIPFALLSPEVVNEATRTLHAIPIAGDPVPRLVPLELFARHAGFGLAFALIAACFIPAVTMWAATLVASSKDLLQIATSLAGAPVRAGAEKPMHVPMLASGGQVLGAIPGFASSVAFVILFLLSPWLVNREAAIDANVGLIAIAIGSILPLVLLRARVAPQMGDILRDVSALDRQRLAFIEVHPLTAIERLVAKLSGAALAYSKDARLMRRRYPMAFALGALAFIILAIIGLAQPDDSTWLVATLAGAGLYAIALARRLGQPPIELARLSSTLPISRSELRRAKIAWIAAWAVVFVALPATFALIRIT
jgi:hypothetical protein